MHAFAIILSLSVLWVVDASASTAPASPGAITNTLCPVLTDEPVDPNIHAVFRGEKVYFCCQKCVRKFTANPDLYLSDLEQIRDSSIANGGHDHADEQRQDNTDKQGHDHADEHEHDHATDHGTVEGFPRLIRFLGKFHPLVVHFPIALLIVAALAEMLRWFLQVTWLRPAARFSVLIASAAAVLAALLGWANAWFGNYPEELQWPLTLHRWLGTTTAVWSIAIAFCSERAARTEAGKWTRSYLITLFLGALLVSITGHFGGTLVFGPGYYSW